MGEPVPLAEQIEEMESEWDRRNRAYPEMVSRGLMRHEVGEMKQDRLSAAIKTMLWLERNQDTIRAYVAYVRAVRYPGDEPDPTVDVTAPMQDDPDGRLGLEPTPSEVLRDHEEAAE